MALHRGDVSDTSEKTRSADKHAKAKHLGPNHQPHSVEYAVGAHCPMKLALACAGAWSVLGALGMLAAGPTEREIVSASVSFGRAGPHPQMCEE